MLQFTLILATLSTNLFNVVNNGSILHSGEATFYSEGALGHCGFPVEQQPQFHGAMNHTDYDSAAVCGTWVHIWGPNDDVVAFIDDECPECKPGDIDLGPITFFTIADSVNGRVPITWRYVPAPDTKPITYHWKEGSSQWHIEIQVLNSTFGIDKLELQTQTSDWVELPRTVYNYFVLPGGIDAQEGPYNIRVTDINGNQLIDENVELVAGAYIEGATNFPNSIVTQKRSLSNRPDLNKMHPKLIFNNRDLSISKHPKNSVVDLFSIRGEKIASKLPSGEVITYLRRNQRTASSLILVAPH